MTLAREPSVSCPAILMPDASAWRICACDEAKPHARAVSPWDEPALWTNASTNSAQPGGSVPSLSTDWFTLRGFAGR